jgi:hypothetical protein
LSDSGLTKSVHLYDVVFIFDADGKPTDVAVRYITTFRDGTDSWQATHGPFHVNLGHVEDLAAAVFKAMPAGPTLPEAMRTPPEPAPTG